ncbi:hypothetical protein TIFTF001_000545 [Ficus carica]|uniref:Malectin-like domain-containing protein n=1 Tax=Ficus carica TaxID=3494 RepID=A0AA88CNA2_FICCA|nr:hypothetical protein TIFTF001_000545 [Ficus carica]
MEIWSIVMVLMFVAPLSLQASSFPKSTLNIDCGATRKTTDDNHTFVIWETDEDYIKTGQNEFLVITNASFYPMKTLRSFPRGSKNCYNLLLIAQTKYLLRAGFYYGNYDNNFKPPTFVLEVDGKLNVTVTTSLSDDPVYHEFIFFVEKENVDVCLTRTQEDHVPFISTIESNALYDSYKLMENHTALYLERRINYGANKTFPERLSIFADEYNRIWTPEEIPSYRSLTPGFDVSSTGWVFTDNLPPYAVLYYAIEAHNSSESLFLPVTFQEKKPQLSAYFVFYFASFVYNPNVTSRTVAIYIDGQQKNITEIPSWYEKIFPVVSIYPVNVTNGMVNVTISAVEGSPLPPLLCAMEVFTAYEVSKASHVIHFVNFSLVLVYFLVLSLSGSGL